MMHQSVLVDANVIGRSFRVAPMQLLCGDVHDADAL